MAESDDKDDRTEEPTQKRLEQAREDGDIIYSSEVGAAFSLIALTIIVAFMSGPLAADFTRAFIGFIAQPDGFAVEPGTLRRIAAAALGKLLAAFGLAALLLALASLAARYVQDKPTFTTKRLAPKPDKLDPVSGFKRVYGKAALGAFTKSIIKLAAVGAVVSWALWPKDASLSRISLLAPEAVLVFVKDKAVALLIAAAAAAALLAAIDYIFTRQSYMKRLRMSRRELKEEARQSEGDPMVRAKLRQIRHERARKRMIAAVPNASVVITNPTHFAVALRYVQGETPAPICLAKGADAVAEKIKEVAREHDIPIVEEPPLARALFATADIDAPIPREHYDAVAKVIGFVMRLARNRRGGPANRRQ